MWIALVGFYGFLKGARDVFKKKSLEYSSVIEVLFFYTLLSFLFVVPEFKTAFNINMSYMPLIAVKSFVIFIGWFCGYEAITKMPVSLYGVTDMARVVFATTISIIFLGEHITVEKGIGLAIVLAGLYFVNTGKYIEKEKPDTKSLVLMLICCLCNAISENLDKYLMTYVNSIQLQFWYMLYLVIFYMIYILIRRIHVNIKNVLKNYWIWICAITFVIGDRALFEACAVNGSSVIAMTLIKQCSVIFTILGGKIVFNEKNIIYRILCAAVIISGIIISLL